MIVDNPASAGFSRRYRVWLLALLTAVTASSALDRLVLAIFGPAIRADLHISDAQFGLLGGLAFAVLYTLMGIPVARLAERRSRVTIITVALAFWSVMTALCGFATTYTHLLLLRLGVSLGESGCSPPSYSLISDHFPPAERASAVALLGMGVPIGSLLCAVVGGLVLPHYGWQAAFVAAGLPGLLLAILVRTTLREPPRGHSDPAPASAAELAVVPPLAAVLARIRSKPSFLHFMAGAALCIFCNFGINLFLPSYLVRVHGLGTGQAALYFGLITGVAAAGGTTGLGLLFGRLARKDWRWYGLGPGLALFATTPFYIMGLLANDATVSIALIFLMSAPAYAFLGPAMGATQNMMPPRMRATAAAIFLFLMNMVGGGLGPFFTGYLSDALATHAFAGPYAATCTGNALVSARCAEAGAFGLRYALVFCTGLYCWAAVHFLLAARTVAQDLREQN
jgi:MFS family permease